jgi:hypothetical protein
MPEDVKHRLQGPPLSRSATIGADSVLDEQERRVRLSFSSEEPYLRSSWFDEPWVEVLGHEADEVDMSRFATGGAPLLYNHNSRGRENHIGVVDRAWLENGKGYADVRLSKRSEVDGIWSDIRDGILTNVSVGYRISERTLTKTNGDKPDEYRVTRWQPMEISMVPLPADETVGVGRSEENKNQKFIIQTVGASVPQNTTPDEEKAMTDEIKDNTPENLQAEETRHAEVDASEIAQRAVEAEQKRQSDIRKLVRTAKLPESVADELVTSNSTLEAARDAVLEKMIERGGEEVNMHHRCEVGPSGHQRFIEDATSAIVARAGYGKTESGNTMRGATLVEMARQSLELAGVRAGGFDKMALVGRAFTQSTSDFPVLLENAMHKVLQASYAAQSDTWSRFCAVGSVSDFRAHNRYRIGSFGNLDKVTELGEFKNKAIPDGEKAVISADTKGNVINLSRQAVINDDLGAFIGMAAQLGRAARRTIEADVYALLALNSGLGPNMLDGSPLFHNRTGGNNIGTAAAIDVASIDADRVLMASQMDVGGNDFLDLRPAVLVVPIGLGGTARVINNAEYDPDTANKLQKPNKVRGLFSDIVDTPRLTGTRRYMFADPNEAPVIEVAFLDGNREPFLESIDGFDVDGTRWKVRIDYGIAAIDYRGAVTNAGTTG